MMRSRYVIAMLVVLMLATGSVIALGAVPSKRGADIPACRSAKPKSPTSATAKHTRTAPPQKQAEPDNAARPPATRFATLTVSIDPKGAPLAAYQFEVTAGHAFTVVGLDNAGNPTFPDAPRYDRSANADATDRLIVADYSTAGPGQLIAKPYPVATIHAAFVLDADTDINRLIDSVALALTAAADADGNPIDADITFDLHFAQGQGTE
ncbi:hypothetical protein OT109_08295 [Phycisphaeraceae bacterium D3-23]